MIKINKNFHPFTSQGEVNEKPSMTIPDQTMSIKEIMRRFAAGLSISDGKVPIYEGEDDILEGVNFKHLDLVEQDEIRRRVKQELADLDQQYEKPKKAGRVSEHAEKPKKGSEDDGVNKNPDPKAKLPAEGEK